MIDHRQQLSAILYAAAQYGASDIHLSPGHYPTLRIDWRLVPLTNQSILDRETLEGLISILVGDKQEEFLKNREISFGYDLEGKSRFRVTTYRVHGALAATLRFIPDEIRSLQDLHLPAVIKVFTQLTQGLVLVVGPSGHGKSTTIAGLVNAINQERAEKVVTIEQPIEHVFKADKSIIEQREVGTDTESMSQALDTALKTDTSVIVTGSMGDSQMMGALMTAAENGHVVFGSLLALTASDAVNRFLAAFPLAEREQARIQFANAISGIIAQRLIPQIKGGLVPAIEVLVATPAVRAHIHDNRINQLDQDIETGYDSGMISLNRSLAGLVRQQEITLEQAETYSLNPSAISSLM